MRQSYQSSSFDGNSAPNFSIYFSTWNGNFSSYGPSRNVLNDTSKFLADLARDNEYKAYLFPLVVSMPVIVAYFISWLIPWIVSGLYHGVNQPPLVPNRVPILGHALSFFWDTGFIGKCQRIFNPGVVRLQLFTTRINFVTGSDNITALWRSKDLDAKAVTSFSLKEFFSTPDRSMKVYLGDSSGVNPKPHPSSNSADEDRYYYQNRKAIVGFFNGPGLKTMGNRFATLLTKEIHRLYVDHQWTEHTDLYQFIQGLLIGPAVEAMCGPVLFSQNPAFEDDFWQLDRDIFYFFKAYPRWLMPRAYQNRAKLLKHMKDWHTFAHENFDSSHIESDGHDQFYGSPLMRTRQGYLSKINALDADAIASQDLGLLWAENANSIPAVFWMMYEALQRPHILSQALEEVVTSQSWSTLDNNPKMNAESLCNMPILQSMYAETLRLYTSLFSLGSAPHGDFDICNFKIPRNELIAVDSRVAAMDSSFWNTGSDTLAREDLYPVDKFWAERFVEYPNDPSSGPLRINASRFNALRPESTSAESSQGPRFTADGLAGAWLPYGGGNRQCPGRQFAKQEIVLGFSIIFSMLEIELVNHVTPQRPDLKYYGLGTLPPKGKVSFRFRKRAQL